MQELEFLLVQTTDRALEQMHGDKVRSCAGPALGGMTAARTTMGSDTAMAALRNSNPGSTSSLRRGTQPEIAALSSSHAGEWWLRKDADGVILAAHHYHTKSCAAVRVWSRTSQSWPRCERVVQRPTHPPPKNKFDPQPYNTDSEAQGLTVWSLSLCVKRQSHASAHRNAGAVRRRS